MALVGDRTFVGFGFGPIQAGLFLYEAFHAGTFRRLVVAEVMPEVVAALRRAKGLFSVNIAHSNRVEAATVGPVEPEDPADPARAGTGTIRDRTGPVSPVRQPTRAREPRRHGPRCLSIGRWPGDARRPARDRR